MAAEVIGSKKKQSRAEQMLVADLLPAGLFMVFNLKKTHDKSFIVILTLVLFTVTEPPFDEKRI